MTILRQQTHNPQVQGAFANVIDLYKQVLTQWPTEQAEVLMQLALRQQVSIFEQRIAIFTKAKAIAKIEQLRAYIAVLQQYIEPWLTAAELDAKLIDYEMPDTVQAFIAYCTVQDWRQHVTLQHLQQYYDLQRAVL